MGGWRSAGAALGSRPVSRAESGGKKPHCLAPAGSTIEASASLFSLKPSLIVFTVF